MKLKKLLFSAFLSAGLLFSGIAHATDYYFSSSSGVNSNPCTQAAPCYDFKGKGLNAVNALQPGDRVFFKRGDEWNGSIAEVEVNSNGTGSTYIATNPIIIDAYGTGNKPVFNGANGVTTTWTLHSGTIWKKTLSSASEVRGVGVDKSYALCVYWGTNTTLPLGSFQFDYGNPGTVYINLKDGSNPNNHNIYVPTYKANGGNGDRGLIRSASSTGGLRGHYIHFKNLRVIYINGVGVSASGMGNLFENVDVLGSAGDGMLFWKWNIGPASTGGYKDDSNSDYGRASGCEISWNVTFGGGHGQGLTVDSSYTWVSNMNIHDNFMAGADWLEYSFQNDVGFGGIVLSTIRNNGIWSYGTSYDPNIYIDGAHHMYIYGNIVGDGGVYQTPGPCGTYSAGSCSNNRALNSRGGIAWGSEHPISNVTTDIYVINNSVNNINWVAMNSGHANCYGNVTECPPDGNTKPNNIKNVWVVNNTVAAKDDSSQNSCFVWAHGQSDATANNWVVKNNIFIADNSLPVGAYHYPGSWLDSNYNLFYRRGQNSSAIIYTGSASYTLTGYQGIGKDLNSLYGNPYIVQDGDTNFDAHLQRTATGHANTSPAIDMGLEGAFTPPNWIPADIQALIGDGSVQGSTRTDNVLDDVNTNMDIGFHYPVGTVTPPPPSNPQGSLTATNVQPASLVADAVGNVVVSFTTENVTKSDGKIQVTLPTSLGNGFIANSGGSTAISGVSGFDGSFAVSVVGNNIIVITRSGGTDSVAGAKSFTLSNIKNPNVGGSTGVYKIETQYNDGTYTDRDLNVAADTITTIVGGQTNFEGITLEGVVIS